MPSGYSNSNTKDETMSEKIYVNVALSNAETCVCCNENGESIDCCQVGMDFGGMYHPDGVDAAQVWAAEHVDLMRALTNQVSACCAGKCQLATNSSLDATSSLPEESNSTDVNTEERTIIVDLPMDGTMVTVNGDGTVQSAESGDSLVVVEIPEGAVTKSGVQTGLNDSVPSSEGESLLASDSDDPEVESPNGNKALLGAGLPESYTDELLGAGLDTPEKVLAFEDLSSIKGIGTKTRDKILRILNEGE